MSGLSEGRSYRAGGGGLTLKIPKSSTPVECILIPCHRHHFSLLLSLKSPGRNHLESVSGFVRD